MEPTLDTGDGFVAIPTALADPVEEGDVIVFRAEELQGGGLTTHRVVGETERGFVTQGDNNPFTDQDSGEPPVRAEQIVAVAWQLGGTTLAIPELGTVVGGAQGVLETIQFRLAGLFGTRAFVGTQGVAYLIFALTAVLYLADARLSADRPHDRSRTRSDGLSARVAVGLMALALVLAATATMAAASGPQSFDIVSSEFESERSDVIERGTSQTLPLTIGNGGTVPVYVFFEPGSENVDIEPREVRIAGNDRHNGSLTLTAPPETGNYRLFVTEHRYLAVLPLSHVRSLYEVHPWLPIVVIDAVIAVPFYLVGIVLVGSGRVRRRSRDGPGLAARVRARLFP
jgi:signal peptidase